MPAIQLDRIFWLFKLKNQCNKIAANVAVPIPPRLKLPIIKPKSPVPKMMVTAATIRFLLLAKLTRLSIQIFAPAMVIKPNTTMDAPVKTGLGMV